MFKNFEDLYTMSCKINKSLDINEIDNYKDLDLINKKYNDKISILSAKGKLLEWDLHPHKDKLLHDYEIEGVRYLLSYDKNMESAFIQDMKNNHNPYLNKWKLNHLERLSFYGWDKYSKMLFDKLINGKSINGKA